MDIQEDGIGTGIGFPMWKADQIRTVLRLDVEVHSHEIYNLKLAFLNQSC